MKKLTILTLVFLISLIPVSTISGNTLGPVSVSDFDADLLYWTFGEQNISPIPPAGYLSTPNNINNIDWDQAELLKLESVIAVQPLIISDPTQCFLGSCLAVIPRSGNVLGRLNTEEKNTNYATEFSISLWINLIAANQNADFDIFGVNVDSAGNRSWRVVYDVSHDDIDLIYSSDGTAETITDGSIIPNDGEWTNVLLTYKTGTWNLYVTEEGNSTQQLAATLTSSTKFDPVSVPDIKVISGGNSSVPLFIDEFIVGDEADISASNPYFSFPTNKLTLDINNYEASSDILITNNKSTVITELYVPIDLNLLDIKNLSLTNLELEVNKKDSNDSAFVSPDINFYSPEHVPLDFYILGDNTENSRIALIFIPEEIGIGDSYSIKFTSGLDSSLNFGTTSSSVNLDNPSTISSSLSLNEDDTLTAPGLMDTNDFAASIAVRLIRAPASGNVILMDRWNASQGFAIETSGTGTVTIRYDAFSCTVGLSLVPGTYLYIQAGVDSSNNSFATVNGFVLSSCTSALGGPLTYTETSIETRNLVGTIYTANVTNHLSTTPDVEGIARFNSGATILTQEATVTNSWQWLFELEDTAGLDTGPARDWDMDITSDISDVDIQVNGVRLASSEHTGTFTTTTPNLIGNLPTVAVTPNPSVNLPFTQIIIDSSSDIGITNQSLWFIFIYAIGVMIAFAIYKTVETEFLAIFMLSIIVLGGTLSNVYSPWMAGATIPITFGTYAITQLRRVGQF